MPLVVLPEGLFVLPITGMGDVARVAFTGPHLFGRRTLEQGVSISVSKEDVGRLHTLSSSMT